MRVTNHVARRRRRNKIMKAAKGFVGGRSKLLRTAKESVMRSRAAAFKGRKERKRQFRRLWITRINAAARARGLSYSQFINGLRHAGTDLDRKSLAELAVADTTAFDTLADLAKEHAQTAS